MEIEECGMRNECAGLPGGVQARVASELRIPQAELDGGRL
jgi:hypothetical protein